MSELDLHEMRLKVPHLHLLNGKLQGCPSVSTTPSINMSGAIELNEGKRKSSQRDVIVGISDAYLYKGRSKFQLFYTTQNVSEMENSSPILTKQDQLP